MRGGGIRGLPGFGGATQGGWTLRAGAWLLGTLTLVAIFGPWLTPQDPNRQLDPAAGRLLAPGASRWLVRSNDGSTRLIESIAPTTNGWRGERLGVSVEFDRDSVAAPPAPLRFWLGTDHFGRDLASRLLVGARISLAIGFLSTLLATLLGTAIGALAATRRGVVDLVLMRCVEALLSFPRLLLILVANTLWRLDLSALILLLGGTTWMETARLARARLLAEQSADYVAAAVVAGLPRSRILLRHLLPNALSPLLADAALRVGDVILLEAALSYLGYGVPVPTASWGRMIADGQDALAQAWWVATLPGIAIVLTVLAFALLADGLRDRLDPALAGNPTGALAPPGPTAPPAGRG